MIGYRDMTSLQAIYIEDAYDYAIAEITRCPELQEEMARIGWDVSSKDDVVGYFYSGNYVELEEEIAYGRK